jgi:hypothetical protein
MFKLNLNIVSLRLAGAGKFMPPNTGDGFLIKTVIRERTPHDLKTIGDDFAIFINLHYHHHGSTIGLSSRLRGLGIVARELQSLRGVSDLITSRPIVDILEQSLLIWITAVACGIALT